MASVVCVLVKICVSSISLYKLDTDKLTAPFESAHQFTLVYLDWLTSPNTIGTGGLLTVDLFRYRNPVMTNQSPESLSCKIFPRPCFTLR